MERYEHSPFLFLFLFLSLLSDFLLLFFSTLYNFFNDQLIINGEIAYEWGEQLTSNIITDNLELYLEEFDREKVKDKEDSGRNGGISQFLNGFWDIK